MFPRVWHLEIEKLQFIAINYPSEFSFSTWGDPFEFCQLFPTNSQGSELLYCENEVILALAVLLQYTHTYVTDDRPTYDDSSQTLHCRACQKLNDITLSMMNHCQWGFLQWPKCYKYQTQPLCLMTASSQIWFAINCWCYRPSSSLIILSTVNICATDIRC